MVTPFDDAGRLDADAAAELMRHLCATGSDGLALAGTTGESSTLDDDEKVRLWETGVEAVGSEAAIVAGTGSNDTRHSVHLTERAAAVGVDAALVVTPYYNKPNPRGILAHFRAVAEATELPIIVYNIPSRCVIDIPNDLLRELARIPHVEGVKQARYENLEQIEGLTLLACNDDMLADVLDLGGAGGILVASHLVGREMRRMIDEPDERRAVEEEIADVVGVLGVAPPTASVKSALAMLGRPAGAPRLPLVEASEEEAAEIRGVLERHSLLSTV